MRFYLVPRPAWIIRAIVYNMHSDHYYYWKYTIVLVCFFFFSLFIRLKPNCIWVCGARKKKRKWEISSVWLKQKLLASACAFLHLIHLLNSSRNDLRHGTSCDRKYFSTHPIPTANVECWTYLNAFHLMDMYSHTWSAYTVCTAYIHGVLYSVECAQSPWTTCAPQIHCITACTHFGANVTNRQCAHCTAKTKRKQQIIIIIIMKRKIKTKTNCN